MNLKKIVIIVLVGLQSVTYSVPWCVVGGGPAGIVVVGLLCDLGFAPEDIIWIDPEFNVGRIGHYYQSVPGNTKTSLYVDFMNACKTFQACQSESIKELYTYDMSKEYPLSIIIKPLQDITDYLRTLVITHQTSLVGLEPRAEGWHLELANGISLDAERVVLATGSHPKSLHYPECSTEISLDDALNKEHLAELVNEDDTVAVVGSAHSAILVLKFLSEMDAGRIINFYTKPLIYPQDMGGWTLYSSSGLKGVAAEWAKNVLEKNPPCNLVRIFNSEKARKAWLSICTKVIYAAGYERTPIPGCTVPLEYDTNTGRIAPGLFGIGIAFPKVIIDQAGNSEYKIGLNSFMEHALSMLPEWARTKDIVCRFKGFEELFSIELL